MDRSMTESDLRPSIICLKYTAALYALFKTLKIKTTKLKTPLTGSEI